MAKSKQPAFRADYVAKLKKLGVYDQFVKNIGEYTSDEDIKTMNESKHFGAFIDAAFIWHRTPEGHDFWENIALS